MCGSGHVQEQLGTVALTCTLELKNQYGVQYARNIAASSTWVVALLPVWNIMTMHVERTAGHVLQIAIYSPLATSEIFASQHSTC